MPSDRPVVAAFDLDGTLTEGGSVVKWLQFVAGRTKVYRAIATHLAPLAYGAAMSGSAADTAKEALFRDVLQGRPLSEVADRSAEFARHHVARELRPQVRAKLQGHLDAGHHVVLVSASPELYAYGNSRGDRRMLVAAEHPVDCGKLGRFGALRAYPRLD